MSQTYRREIYCAGGGFTDRADRQDINIRLSGSNQLLENVDLTHSVHPDVVIIGMGFF